MVYDKNKISVIIPTYNNAEYISAALDSVLNQEHKHVEIIVVDDGSTDNTESVLLPYVNKKLIRYIHQENQGVASARNAALNLAIGEYVAFLDADDILLSGSLTKRITLMQEYGDVDFVFTDYHVEVSEGGRNKYPYMKEKNRHAKFSTALDKSLGLVHIYNSAFRGIAIKENIFPWTGAIMVRQKCFDQISGFDVSLRASSDKKMWLQLLDGRKVGYIDEPLSVYKAHQSTITRDTITCCENSIRNSQHLLQQELKMGNTEVAGLRRKISHNFNRLGYQYLYAGSTKQAQSSFMKSIQYCPIFLNSYFYLFISLIPRSLYNLFRTVWREVRGGNVKPKV